MKNKLYAALIAATFVLPGTLHATDPNERLEYQLAPGYKMDGYDVIYNPDKSRDLLRDYPARNADGTVNIVVEIPAGDLRKFETDHETGRLFWELKRGVPRVVQYLPYPGNYGSVPGTHGGDGDPLDIITIGPRHLRGEVVPVKIIGILYMIDDGEEDSKLIGVIPGTNVYEVDDMDELDANFPGISSIISTWLTSYKGPDGGIECAPGGCFGDAAEANDRLDDAIANYEANGI